MDNLTAGNPVAHRVRVHFVDTSTVIYEGMPVCYNFDTTTNWWGGSVSNGEVTVAATLADGNQNPAKYLEVELPSATNIQWFAGVVAKGGWVGKTTSGTAGVGQILDIYVPNGAILPVRTDQTCLIGQTILAINDGESELGVPLRADSRPVALSMEAEDRATAGLVLAKLDPNLFIYQDHAGTALSVDNSDTTADTVVNRIRVKSLQTGGQFTALSIRAESAAGAGTINQRGMAVRAVAVVSATPAGQVHGSTFDLEITSGTITEPVSACLIKLYESGATVSGSNVFSVLTLQSQVAQAPTALHHCWVYLEQNGAQVPDCLFRVADFEDFGGARATAATTDTTSHDFTIPICLQSDVRGHFIYYLRAYADDQVS